MKRTDDFFGDLEHQLVSAAEARAAGTLKSRPRAWRGPVFAVAATAVAAVVAIAAVFGVADRTGTTDPDLPAATSTVVPGGDCSAPMWIGEAVPYLQGEPPERDRPSRERAQYIRRLVVDADLRLTRRIPNPDATNDGEFYVVPTGICTTGNERATDVCFVVIKDGGSPQPSCMSVDAYLRGESSVATLVFEHAVVGLVPPDAERMSLDYGKYGTAGVQTHSGVVGQTLPAELQREAIEDGTPTFRYWIDDDTEVELEDRTKGLPRVQIVAKGEDGDRAAALLSPTEFVITEVDQDGGAVEDSVVEAADGPAFDEAIKVSELLGVPSRIESRLPDGVDVRVRLAPDQVVEERPERATNTIAILNGTTVPGLGAVLADDLRGNDWNVEMVGNAPDQVVNSTIYFTSDVDKDTARKLSMETGIKRIAAMEPDVAAAAPDVPVVIVAGRDRVKERTP